MIPDSPPSTWQSLPKILAYPARPELLGTILFYSLLGLLSLWLGSGIRIQWLPTFVVSGSTGSAVLTLVGALLDLAVIALSLKLAVETLLDTAHDRLDPGKAGPAWASDDHAAGQFFLIYRLLR